VKKNEMLMYINQNIHFLMYTQQFQKKKNQTNKQTRGKDFLVHTNKRKNIVSGNTTGSTVNVLV
jgi:hypothetical protein